MSIGNKRIWVRCRGILISLWGWECFEKVIGLIGSLIKIDKDTVEEEQLEFARLCIRLPIESIVNVRGKIKINGIIYQISIREEMSSLQPLKCTCRAFENNAKDESSSNSFTGNVLLDSSDSNCASWDNFELSQGNDDVSNVSERKQLVNNNDIQLRVRQTHLFRGQQ